VEHRAFLYSGSGYIDVAAQIRQHMIDLDVWYSYANPNLKLGVVDWNAIVQPGHGRGL
jgi:hypothetical protein